MKMSHFAQNKHISSEKQKFGWKRRVYEAAENNGQVFDCF